MSLTDGHFHIMHQSPMPPRQINEIEGPYKHLIIIFLETATADAWPYNPAFTNRSGLTDILPEKNKPEYMTPFFHHLKSESFAANNFYSSARCTQKIQFIANCGVDASHTNGVNKEYRSPLSRPCLSHILKSSDKSFTAAYFQAANVAWGHVREFMHKLGFETVFAGDDLELMTGHITPTNYFRYNERDITPAIWSHIDEAKESGDRILLELLTTTNHHPWTLPLSETVEIFTEQNDQLNAYLNTNRYVDRWLNDIYTGLEGRGILDDAMLVVLGDHGANWGQFPEMAIQSSFGENQLHMPMIIHTPKTRERARQGLPALTSDAIWSTLDLLPTLLDAMGISETVLQQYPGSSILRTPPQESGNMFAVGNPGTFPYIVRYGCWKFVAESITYQVAFDLCKDPHERFSYDLGAGWIRRKALTQQMETGAELYLGDLEAEKAFTKWVLEQPKILHSWIERNRVEDAEDADLARSENFEVVSDEIRKSV